MSVKAIDSGLSKVPEIPLVSIVASVRRPVPGAEDWLGRVLDQGYSNWELLLVADKAVLASSQVGGRLLDDPRIQFVDQGEAVYGAARNTALQRCKGDYLLFMDETVFVAPDLIENAVREAEESQADMALISCRLVDMSQLPALGGTPSDSWPAPCGVFSCCDYPDAFFQITLPERGMGFYRCDFVRDGDLRFLDIPFAEDFLFRQSALVLADRLVIVDGCFAEVRRHADEVDYAPLSGIRAIEKLGDFMVRRRGLPLLRTSFMSLACGAARYSLCAATTDGARAQILSALETDFSGFLDSDEAQRVDGCGRDGALFVAAALRQHRVMSLEQREETDHQIAPALLFGERQGGSPAISVVIPVYNAEDYVAETLESVLRQTLFDLEVICVDDGSTDGSRDILLSYAERDPRVLVFGQENRGLSCARNAGMAMASGRYLHFLDSDDKIAPEAYQELFVRASEEDLDLMLFDAGAFFEDERAREMHPSYLTYYHRSQEYRERRPGPNMLDAMARGGDYRPSACLYLLKRGFAAESHLFFHPAIVHEDNGFTFAALLKAERVAHLRKPLYERRVRRGSIMTSKKTFANAYGYYVNSIDMMRSLFSAVSVEDESALQSALALAFAAQRNARHDFSALPSFEHGALCAFDAQQKAAFLGVMDTNHMSARAYGEIDRRESKISALKSEKEVLLDKIDCLESDKQEAVERAELATREIGRLRASYSFRIGHAVTSPLRRLRKLRTRLKLGRRT